VYGIITSVDLFPACLGLVLQPLQNDWHQRANKAIVLIHLRCCCNDLLAYIDDIDDPVEMWKALRDRLDNASTKLGRPSPAKVHCYDMEVGKNCVYRLRYREKGVRRRETRDICRRHQPRLQPAVSDPCIYVTFTASRPSSDETVTQYFIRLIAFRKKLVGTTEQISYNTTKTHIFTTLPDSYETTIQILEQRLPAP
jgi:hypothetical protein